MNAYLDSSVLLRLILGEPGQLTGWNLFDRLVCSEMAEVECLRTIDRLRIRHRLSDEEILTRREALFQLLEAIEVVEVSRPILKRAADTFPVMIGTLDAIHLATALAWQDEYGESLTFATHDQMLGKAAKATGLKTAGV